jgi:hypothetical protein
MACVNFLAGTLLAIHQGMKRLNLNLGYTFRRQGWEGRNGNAPLARPALNLRSLMGADAWARLPEAVQRRFAAGHAAVVYDGDLSVRCSGVGRLLAWLIWPLRGPLLPHCWHQRPTTVSVAPDGRGGVIWSRRVGGRTVCSVKQVHPRGGVLERTVGGLAMALDVFEDAGQLVFQSRHYAWCCGPVYLRLPDWLTPGVCRVAHQDLGEGRFRFTLAMNHPLWGETFHQTGVFHDPHPEN